MCVCVCDNDWSEYNTTTCLVTGSLFGLYLASSSLVWEPPIVRTWASRWPQQRLWSPVKILKYSQQFLTCSLVP